MLACDVYRAVVSYDKPPLGIMIDERKAMATMVIVEEFKQSVSGWSIMPNTVLKRKGQQRWN